MSVEVNCSGCGVKLRVPPEQVAGVICPRCLAEITGQPMPVPEPSTPRQTPERPRISRPEGWIPDLNTDVRREMSQTAWVLLMLIVLCVVGLILTLGWGPPRNGRSLEGWLSLLMVGFVALDILVIVALLLQVWKPTRSQEQSGEAALKVVLTIIIVSGVTVVMAVVGFFATCSSVLMRM